LWRGLRTPPRSATEGLRPCTDVETFGPSRWPGPETGPQRGGDRATTRRADLRSEPVARSGDRATTRRRPGHNAESRWPGPETGPQRGGS